MITARLFLLCLIGFSITAAEDIFYVRDVGTIQGSLKDNGTLSGELLTQSNMILQRRTDQTYYDGGGSVREPEKKTIPDAGPSILARASQVAPQRLRAYQSLDRQIDGIDARIRQIDESMKNQRRVDSPSGNVSKETRDRYQREMEQRQELASKFRIEREQGQSKRQDLIPQRDSELRAIIAALAETGDQKLKEEAAAAMSQAAERIKTTMSQDATDAISRWKSAAADAEKAKELATVAKDNEKMARIVAQKAFLRGMDRSPIPISIGPSSTADELERARNLQSFNEWIAKLPPAGPNLFNVETYAMLRIYSEHHMTPWVLPLCADPNQ